MGNGNKKVEASDLWKCETCGSQQMSYAEMKEHLKTAHAMNVDGLKGKRQMLMHMDARDWFSFRWQWTFETLNGPITVLNETVSPRAKNDPMGIG